jgi:hypothetical protein
MLVPDFSAENKKLRALKYYLKSSDSLVSEEEGSLCRHRWQAEGECRL